MAQGNGGGSYIDFTSFEKPDDAELDARLLKAREAYSKALNEILDRVADEFDDPMVAQFVVQDFGMFAVFLVSTKMVELAGEPPWRKRFLSAFQYLVKRIEREVPENLILLARSIAGGRIGEDGEGSQP